MIPARCPLLVAPLLAALAALAGCVVAPLPRPAAADGPSLAWPAPPEPARLRFQRGVTGPRDLGISRGAVAHFFQRLFGARDPLFVRPTGVAARDGVLYVADPDAHCVWILDAAHRRAVSVNRAGTVTLRAPIAVAPAADGAVYVADPDLGQVLLFDRRGQLLRVAAADGLQRPVAVAYDLAAQLLYVADSATSQVHVYGADGAPVRIIGGPGEGDGQFNHPTHLALDTHGLLLVTDALNFRIQAFDAQGRRAWMFGRHGDGSGDFAAPKGVASDAAGHVYVIDALFDALQLFDPAGTLLLTVGRQGHAAGEFWLPTGLYVDERGDVYVADSYNARVQVFAAAPAMREAQ